MQVLIINGSPHKDGSTFRALSEAAEALHKNGLDTLFVHIGTNPIQDCVACHKCAQTGYCSLSGDMVNDCIDLLKKADGVIVGSPVYFAGPSGSLCSLLDRMFFRRDRLFAFKPSASVVVCRRGGASAAFDRLNKYFTKANMPVVSSQYWNMAHGQNSAEQVSRDAEGLQTMRTLGNNMAWLIKCINVAKATVPYPELEKTTPTNFIR